MLVEWDEGAAQKRLLQKIKEDEQLYTIMRSTELFEEMEKFLFEGGSTKPPGYEEPKA